MADLDYDVLKEQYKDFSTPRATVMVGGKDLMACGRRLTLTDLDIDLSSDFEASVASFCLYNVFDEDDSTYLTAELGALIYIGSEIKIALGYSLKLKYVFTGVITKINFVYDDPGLPFIRITAMDIKGIMMANNYSKQLTSKYYSDAVNEIFSGSVYQKMMRKGIITELMISDTPDNPKAAAGSAASLMSGELPSVNADPTEHITLEMVNESDYEFILKAAKKFNYEFFVSSGQVVFRPAKSDTSILMDIAPYNILRSFDIEYDITGQVSNVEVRATDASNGELISAKKSISNTWSQGSNAQALVKGSTKVYLDSTVRSKKEAGYRADYLAEDISYRFGTLSCETLGLPELVPGRFVEVRGLGSPVNNTFYLVSVRHRMTQRGEYKCVLKGKACGLAGGMSGLPISQASLMGNLPF